MTSAVPLVPSDRAIDRIKRADKAEGDRGTWEAHWEEIAQRVLPSYANSFLRKGFPPVQGEKRTEEMVDATAALALPKFAAAMESMLTPRNSTWHGLTAMDKRLRQNKAVKQYFDDVLDALFRYRYAPRANFASQQHEIYMGLGAFGTGAMFIDPLDGRWGGGLRYRAIHLAEVFFMENHQGIIDTAVRKFQMTARQAVQWFGKPTDTLPAKVREAIANGESEKMFTFLHTVMPRSDEDGYDPDRLDVKGMVFASYYDSVDEKTQVREGGYNTFPYAISRYVVAPGETYGRSPAMLALPTIKVLNEEKKIFLKQGHRSVDPVLLAHDDGMVEGLTIHPGAINPGGVTADGRPLVHTLPVGNIAIAKEMMQEERTAINDAFLVTLFQILIETPQMTATEVLERAREKGALLSPTMGRQQSENLGPMIDREIDVLSAQGRLPPMPPILRAARAEYDVVYDSPLSRAQRAEKAAGFMQWINWLRDIISVTQDPSPMDWADWDKAMPDLADISAVPQKWVRDAQAVAGIRDARAKAAQTQQMVDAAPAAAGVLKALPQVKTNLSGNAQ